jgi:hypothetical protein
MYREIFPSYDDTRNLFFLFKVYTFACSPLNCLRGLILKADRVAGYC